jgi:hypothetical protein
MTELSFDDVQRETIETALAPVSETSLARRWRR